MAVLRPVVKAPSTVRRRWAACSGVTSFPSATKAYSVCPRRHITHEHNLGRSVGVMWVCGYPACCTRCWGRVAPPNWRCPWALAQGHGYSLPISSLCSKGIISAYNVAHQPSSGKVHFGVVCFGSRFPATSVPRALLYIRSSILLTRHPLQLSTRFCKPYLR